MRHISFTRIILTVAIAVTCMLTATAKTAVRADFKDETLTYKVMYKWGLVHKQAGTATLTAKNHGDLLITQLTARSESWADRFYRVRDTLNGSIIRETFRPVYYEKIAREGSDNKHDRVDYKYPGAKVIGHCTRRAWDEKGKLVRDEKRTLDAYGTTVDMLSAFYYMRSLPYASWQKNHVVTVNIYSGKRKELLTIKYLGEQNVKVDNKSIKCYHITFIFTSDGRTKSSDDMEAWISADSRHLPIKLEGKLKVGKVQCFYTGKL